MELSIHTGIGRNRKSAGRTPEKPAAAIQDTTSPDMASACPQDPDQKTTLHMMAQILDQIPEAVTITDGGSRLLYVNAGFVKLYGWRPAEVLGRPVTMLNSTKLGGALLDGIVHATLDGGWDGDLPNRDKKGREFTVHLHTSAVTDMAGRRWGLLGLAVETGAVERMERMDRKLDELLARQDRFENHMLGALRRPAEVRGPDPGGGLDLGRLSRRELEIFNLVGRGFSPKEITAQVGLSIHTIHTHLKRLREKLGLQDHSALIRAAALHPVR